MLFGQSLNSHRIFKRLAKALIRLRGRAGWSEPLLVAYLIVGNLMSRFKYTSVSLCIYFMIGHPIDITIIEISSINMRQLVPIIHLEFKKSIFLIVYYHSLLVAKTITNIFN